MFGVQGADLTEHHRNHPLQGAYWGRTTSCCYGWTPSAPGALQPRSAGPPSEPCSSPPPAPTSDSTPATGRQHGDETSAGRTLIDMEDLLGHMLCLRGTGHFFVMNLNADLVSSSPEPNTTVSVGRD